jgi:hydroxyethylthiazole kinase-like uncharacterized protein yjeF
MNSANPVYLTAEIRKIEEIAAALPEPPALMEKAGLAAAQVAAEQLLTRNMNKVLVLAGPGNNGGDAFVAARYLKQWQFVVTLVFTGIRERLSSDARHALDAWLSVDGEIRSQIPGDEKWHAVIDGLFGIGMGQSTARNLEGKYLDLVNTVNGMDLPVLSLDVPSGLGSDNGHIHGAAIRASITVTFIGLKPGLLTNDGPEYCGQILVRELALDVHALLPPQTWAANQASVQRLLPSPRPANSHKGIFGSIGVLGGSTGMIGAALLAGKAALKFGAGRVYLGLIAHDAPAVDSTQPELMLRTPRELLALQRLSCLVVGPGLGTESDAGTWLDYALGTKLPLVLDADALNQIAAETQLANKLQLRQYPTIITPHPAEAARLLKEDTATIQSDRMAAAEKLAQSFHCYAVLKGAGSICVSPENKRYINCSGNPGLSSAGTGDVLSGMIGALLTQGLNAQDALVLAVYLHGAAADELLEKQGGPVGMTASEIINSARYLLNKQIYGTPG